MWNRGRIQAGDVHMFAQSCYFSISVQRAASGRMRAVRRARAKGWDGMEKRSEGKRGPAKAGHAPLPAPENGGGNWWYSEECSCDGDVQMTDMASVICTTPGGVVWGRPAKSGRTVMRVHAQVAGGNGRGGLHTACTRRHVNSEQARSDIDHDPSGRLRQCRRTFAACAVRGTVRGR